MISIIIPMYNAASYLEETLNSVLCQTIDPQQLELILVDDGSQDDSAKIAQNILTKQHILYSITITPNRGPSHARNIGWQQARGEWIQFLDADDLLAPEKIEFQYQRIPADKRVAVIYSQWQHLSWRNATWLTTGSIAGSSIGEGVTQLLRTENFIQLGSALFRRAWLEHVAGFNEASWLIEDVELMLKIAMANGRFHFAGAGRPLFYYRQHAKSLSNRDKTAFMQACLRNAQSVEQWLQQQSNITAEDLQILLQTYYYIARNTYRIDTESFETAYRALCRLASDKPYYPQNPKHLALLSRLLGYKKAEEIAYWYRKCKLIVIGR